MLLNDDTMPQASSPPGKPRIRHRLPKSSRPWEQCGRESLGKESRDHQALAGALHRALERAPLEWPKRPIFFVTDPHADAEAFLASLVATGGIRRTGPKDKDFKLTREGRKGRFIIGGDCLDKGPSNLRLLRAIRRLMDSGARVHNLAGNHDIRLQLGLRTLEMERDPRTEHFFLRMGAKVVPLLKELRDYYLPARGGLKGIPSERDCKRRLYPSKHWFEEFPEVAQWVMPERTVAKETKRLREKLDQFAAACDHAALSMRQVYATAGICRRMFLEPDGEFGWFFKDMQLARREGSFLFIHAGLDDRIATQAEQQGVRALNRQFKKVVWSDPFEFYYGPLANAMRTKYRAVDMPLTHHGVERIHRQGIHAVVHGHANRTHGQRLMLRQGLLHIEGDITLDRNTRKKEGLDGYGAGATVIRPEGRILGISTDYPAIKAFDPRAFLNRE